MCLGQGADLHMAQLMPVPLTQGGHSPGKPGIVREFKSGQGKVRGKCVLHVATYHAYSSQNMQEQSSLLGIVKKIVVIVMTVYMSTAVRVDTP